jgi:hypothetical protein
MVITKLTMGIEPTLKIDLLKRRDPECSFCGMQFGSEGLTRDLMVAFASHVRRRHLEVAVASSVSSERLSRDHLRASRRM